MKVLFLTNIPSPYRIDFFDELGKQLDLTVLIESEINNENRQWKVDILDKNFKHETLNISKKNITKGVFNLYKHFSKNNYDIYVIGGYSTLGGILSILILKLMKKKFILNADGGFIDYNESWIKYFTKKILISSAEYWLSSGKSCTDYFAYYGAEVEKIYNYEFTSIFESDVLSEIVTDKEKYIMREALSIKEEKVVISVGRFIESKGFDTLIKCSKNLSENIGIYIIGGTPTDEYLRLKSEYAKCKIHFLDFKDTKELDKYYKAADIFVLPTRSDVWGLVVNEAMAKGLPIITTNRCIAGLELVSNGENGFIVNVDDIDDLANKIKLVADNYEVIRSMSNKSLEIIKNYTIENMAKSHINIFYKINKQKENRCENIRY